MASKNPGIVLPNFDGIKRDLPQRDPVAPLTASAMSVTTPRMDRAIERHRRAHEERSGVHPLLARAKKEATEQLNTRVPVRLVDRMRQLKVDCKLDQTAVVIYALEKVLPELEAASELKEKT